MNQIRILLTLALTPIINCGAISLGGGNSNINDAVPDGTIVSQGSFTGQNGTTVSGVAAIYLTTEGFFILRLESLNIDTASNRRVVLMANDEVIFSGSLKGSTGNQNYTLSTTSNSWTSVRIEQTNVSSSNNSRGVALLEST